MTLPCWIGEFEKENPNPGGADKNTWATKLTMTLADGNERRVYTNSSGSPILDVFEDSSTGDKWNTSYEKDTSGRTKQVAAPSTMGKGTPF